MNGTKVPLIALKLPRVVALLILFVQHVVQAMTNSSWFTGLTALLAQTTADLAALQAAQVVALTLAKGAAAVRNDKKKAVVDDLFLLKSAVTTLVNQNPGQAATIITAAGFFLKKYTTRSTPNLRARTTVTPGEVLVRAKAIRGAAYEWQMSSDGGKTWVSMGTTTVSDTSTTGLTVGGSYVFRFRTTVKRATSDWSPPLPFIVT
jgi:hypothetical protein